MAADPELDDVAFLSGGEDNVRQTKNTIIVCSQKRAICVAGLVCGSLLMTALIVAYGGTASDCSCSSEHSLSTNASAFNESGPFKPIATNGDLFPWLNASLPTFVKPISYTITVHPNLTTYDVKGQVAIEIAVVEETQYIIIHSQNLNVTERAIMISGNRGHTIKIIRLLEFPPRQQLYIEFKEKLKKKNNYTLNLRWYSKLNFEPHGFYLDYYENSKGLQRFLAATVFQPRGARKYFPCFNEPQFRTPFKVSIFRDRFHIGLSNSNVHKTEDVGFYMGTGLLRDDFMETPRLSTDSISWVISDFERKSLDVETVPIINLKTLKKQNEKVSIKSDKNITKNNKKIAVRSIASLTHSLNLKTLSMNNSMSPIMSTTVNRNSPNNTAKHLRENVSYTFYAPEDLLTRANLIMKSAKDVMNYFESWLDIKYPMTKLDFVALPSLQKNIISSLGLISLKISFLLDQKSTTTEENQFSTLRISEAIVQQFFGGVTSSTSAKDSLIWHGLVKYLSILILSSLHTHWPLREMYTLHLMTKTMDIDAMQGWASIVSATELIGQNDEFYVDKTVAVFGMLHSTIGETRFKKCLEQFLKENYFQVDDVKNVWSTCNKSNDMKPKINVEEMMSLWMNKQGFPLITVTRVGNNVTLSQSPFRPNYSEPINETMSDHKKPDNKKNEKNEGTHWALPIKYVTNMKNSSEQLWMNKANVSFQVTDDVKWIKLNAGQSGFYRVLYNSENWQNVIDELIKDHNQFSPEDRVGLLSDAFTLCHSNLLNCEIIMNMIPYLPNETKWGPITLAFRHLEKWRRILKYSECFLMLSEFIKTQLASIIEKIGYVDDGDLETKMLRPEILLASILWEDRDVILKSKLVFNQFIYEKNEPIPPNLREVIYTGAILSGEYVFWQYCWEKFLSLQNTAGNFTERMQLVRALGRTKDVWLQNRLLSHITLLPTTEVVEVLQSIAGTPVGGAIACRFLQANWYDLQSRLGEGSVSFAKVISTITQYGSTNFDYDELKSLLHRFGHGPGLDILKMTVQTVASNKEWVARSQSSLYKWIEHNLNVT
ncbi:endoplasmic reticulum aminopeptidase 2 [Episyrphus balteatus]|uniref:endoplasmic reticulum aminopeptidase 2 n=1 Tax=Episyrphus balteatus TaxID=286459 RepID=UPI0024859137|nr:endoplasmic reticulum aminopeptidase 2 [Episyrphus balteatus]